MENISNKLNLFCGKCRFTAGLSLVFLLSCNSRQSQPEALVRNDYADIVATAAMKEVMWKGELWGKIKLDTLAQRKGVYGIGPVSYLRGEVLVNDGIVYTSRVESDSTMIVEEKPDTEAPFFVHGYVKEWEEVELPDEVKDLKALEKFLDAYTKNYKRPFVFKLTGEVMLSDIHVQNLPEGTKVRSPQEAHQGQVNYSVREQAATIIGFFSTSHQGVFTHHDSYIHAHFLSDDKQWMGHLDLANFENDRLKLWLPKS